MRQIALLLSFIALAAVVAGCGAELLAIDPDERAGRSSAPEERQARGGQSASACQRTARVVEVGISATRYPRVLAHIDAAVRAGWPRVLRIRRDGAAARRDRALRGIPTRPGYDRDEWPMAMARADWRAHVAYVPSGENRGAGASVGLKLRRWCDGTRFTVVGY
ncbi:MAG TPA: NucA/NucB deoxyribonuclease domain-containing protein [Conexibacter sp.]|nr:NucA/NucB deoxyribonuclease domain-containing protein [Conexibacter sp.]